MKKEREKRGWGEEWPAAASSGEKGGRRKKEGEK